MNNKKIQVWLPLLFSITMIAGMFIGYKMRDNMPGKSFFYTEKRRPVQEIIDLIQHKYVDEVNVRDLTDTAIQAMLSKLDPHSVFIPAEELQQVNDDLAGKFSGIGIEFNIFDDTLNVIYVFKDGPGFKAGLVPGDKIIRANDSLIAGKKLGTDSFRKIFRGERGSEISIDVLRNGSLKKITITRDNIPVPSLDAAYMLTKTTGYIRLNKFSSHTYHEFMEALLSLKKQGLQQLVLDLRDNGGGLLEEATDIADELLDGDKLITYTEGKHTEKREYRCHRPGQFETGALVVLANEGTASASEILIGALQDWDRATVIGRRSFGKGLVQEQFDLSDHSALRLTIARYYTPVGRSIQRPYTNGGKAYYDEIINRYHDGETSSADSVKLDKSKVFKTHAGKLVYGSGGINPDFFIPLDTTRYSGNMLKLYNGNTISNFAYHYFLEQPAIKEFKTAADFAARFSLSEDDWKRFAAAAETDSVSLQNISPAQKADLQRDIKSTIARQRWRSEGYFEVQNSNDEAIKKALSVLGQ
ncbi:MAG: S41 family peptidase [Ferruginibacter sp.]